MTPISHFAHVAAPLGPQATVAQALDALARAEVAALPVREADGRLGLVEREVAEEAARAGYADRAIEAILTRDVLTVDPSAPAEAVVERLLEDRAALRDFYLVALDDGRLGVGDLPGLARALIARPAAEAGLSRAVEQEFRGPLAEVAAMAELLERQPLAEAGRTYVRAIRDAACALEALLDDARALSEDAAAPVLEATGLRALMDEVQGAWSDRARHAGVRLMVAYDGDPDLTVTADRAGLRRVFDNMLGAALRRGGEGVVEAGLRARREGGEVFVQGSVRDNAPGLDPDRLARVFEPGEGGLAICAARRHVERMNGSIHAQSNPGAGLTLAFELMAAAAEAPAPAALQPADAAAHVLVVDDNATNRMVAEALCEMFDCTSESVEDGVEAVEAARNGRFDLILMDIKMPRMDGVAACRAIRELPGPAGRTPIIALTANVDPEDARAYLAAGMCAVVEKPIKPERLLQAINSALDEADDGDRGAEAAA